MRQVHEWDVFSEEHIEPSQEKRIPWSAKRGQRSIGRCTIAFALGELKRDVVELNVVATGRTDRPLLDVAEEKHRAQTKQKRNQHKQREIEGRFQLHCLTFP